ncbi:MAG: hypothetical protein U9N76_06980 [Candidatus Marinimicrobia bacterium]|nr:hypothetical protein [Candidatus Neomarinimicrobiota bacterium]
MKKQIFLILMSMFLFTNIFAQTDFDKKSVLKSVVLPGWGEMSYNKNRSKLFFISELTIWASYFTFNKYHDIQDNDMKNYAEVHSGADDFSDVSQYWVDLGSFYSYENFKERMLELRTPEKIWDEKYAWDWDSNENANKYRNMRIDRDMSLLRAKFSIGGLVLNRIISAIDVIYLSNNSNKVSTSMSLSRDKAVFKISIPINKIK